MSTLRVDNLRGQTTDNVHKYIVQVQQLSNTGRGAQVSNNSSSFAHVGTKFDVSITPKFSTSKILYFGNFSVEPVNNATYGYLDLRRVVGGVETSLGDAGSGTNYGVAAVSHADWRMVPVQFLDSPATTSEITYKIYQRPHTNGNNITFGWGSSSSSTHNLTFVTIMEIAQ